MWVVILFLSTPAWLLCFAQEGMAALPAPTPGPSLGPCCEGDLYWWPLRPAARQAAIHLALNSASLALWLSTPRAEQPGLWGMSGPPVSQGGGEFGGGVSPGRWPSPPSQNPAHCSSESSHQFRRPLPRGKAPLFFPCPSPRVEMEIGIEVPVCTDRKGCKMELDFEECINQSCDM